MPSIGSNRRNAGARALGLLVYALIWALVGWIVVLLVFAVAILDIFWQGLTNREGFTDKNPVAHLWHWNKRLMGWLLFDKGSRPGLDEARPSGGWTRR